MRIIGGEAGGRIIQAPSGTKTRPTTDRVREALFSILESHRPLVGIRLLDLYAGSGALALEGISRGAASALCVEANAHAVTVLRRNIQTLGYQAQCRIWPFSVEKALKKFTDEHFQLIFADPPYDTDPQTVLQPLSTTSLQKIDDLFVYEHSSKRPLPNTFDDYVSLTHRVYGDSALTIYTKLT